VLEVRHGPTDTQPQYLLVELFQSGKRLRARQLDSVADQAVYWADLADGRYEVHCSAPGYARSVYSVIVSGSDVTRLNVKVEKEKSAVIGGGPTIEEILGELSGLKKANEELCSKVQKLESKVAVIELRDNVSDAAGIARDWWYSGDGKSRPNESSQKTGAGPKDGTFFAYTGTITNLGSYADAWNFFSKKCGAKETFDESPLIVGQPSDRGGYYTIFRRVDGGRKTTTFASHEREATITVYLHEIEATADKTVLQLSVVVVRR
jgi:hypothetical protein